MTVAVLVPTYRRPQDLRRCLSALGHQTLPPDLVVVVVRRDDAASHAVLDEGWTMLPLRLVEVDAPGVVHALNCGLAVIDSEIVAIIDDDTAPRPAWLARIVDIFTTRTDVGGLGGRDWVHQGGRVESGTRDVVGRMTWYGRCIGNHHLGAGAAREVQFLKGANMSYRRSAIDGLTFDERLRGTGAQVCNDMGFSVAVHRRGWVLLYDPQVELDHYPGVRHDEDRRNEVSYLACHNAAFNQALIVCEALGRPRALAFLVWAVLVGTRGEPGLLQMLRLLPAQRGAAIVRARANIRGAVEGWSAARW